MDRRTRGFGSRVAVLAAAVLSVGCGAARARRAADARALAAADAQVLAGCYDCLRDAHTTYERLVAAGAADSVRVRLFETEVLLALREKELALDATATLERARAVAPRLPASLDAARM